MGDAIALRLNKQTMTSDEFVCAAVELADAHHAKATWYASAPHRWVSGLAEELGELAQAVEGTHEHPPQLELMQIIAIAINMHRRFYAETNS